MYFVIYRDFGNNINSFVAIVEKEEIAIDFCNKHPGCYFIKEDIIIEEETMMGD